MSSRREEKERLRSEREAQEQAAQRSEARRRRLVFGGAGLAAVVAVAALVVVLASGGDGDEGGGGGETTAAAIPARAEEDLNAAARAAGCKVTEHRDFGRDHTSEDVDYETNPPTSGPHDPVAAEDGLYAAGNSPDKEQSVHALEHGRINLQYRKGTPANRIGQLETLFNEEVNGQSGYHTLVYENQTEMPAAVAATAWKRSITCAEFTDKTFDALRAFREDFVDKGPELIP